PALRVPVTPHLPLRLRSLGVVEQHLLHRGTHDRQRFAVRRSTGERATGYHRRRAAESALLAHALRQRRGLCTHGQKLRRGGDRLAVPLGRRALISAGRVEGTIEPRSLVL